VSQKLKHILPKQYTKSKELLQSKKMDGDKLRTYKGLEDISNEEANHIIEQLERLARILYQHIIKEETR